MSIRRTGKGKNKSARSSGLAGPTLAFTGALTLANAEQVRASLIAALREQPSVVVDCSAADEIDLTFIQCLMAARRTAAALGKSTALAAPASGALKGALTRGGFLNPSAPDAAFWMSGATTP